MDARRAISEVNDVLGLSLPTTEFHTVDGLVIARLRRLPKEGDSIVESGFCFRVVEATGRSITRIVVERDRPQPAQQRRRRWPRIGKE
jgi:putative hemolysin